MLSCREVAILLSQDVDEELSALDRATLQTHLSLCDACVKISQQLHLLKSAVAKRNDPDDLPAVSEDTKARLKGALQDIIDESKRE